MTLNGSKKSKVFLVDDHRLVRRHVTALLSAEPDLEVCGEAGDATTALAQILEQSPDLVLLDMVLKRSSGLELLGELKRARPELRVLVLSMHDETLYAERAIAGGARGYITKEEAALHLLTAIRQVLAGQAYISERIATRMAEAASATASSNPPSQPA